MLSGDRGFALPSESDIARLRRYITYGGFLLIDSCEGRAGGGFDESVRRLLAQTLPGELPIRIPESHVLWKSFYVLHGAPGRIIAAPYLEGVERDRRLAVVYTQNDLGGAWARDGFGRWEHEVVPGGDDQREEAFRLGRQPGDVRALPRLQDRAGAHRLHPAHRGGVSRAMRPARWTAHEPLACPAGSTTGALGLGAASHYGRGGVALLVAAAVVAVALSALALNDERPARAARCCCGLRVAGVLACLLTALEPTVELRQVTRVPNRVAVLVDASRSMEVRPPDGGPSRAERAAALLDRGGARAGGAAARRPRHRPLQLRRGRLAGHRRRRCTRRPRPTPPASARRSASCARATPAAISARWC